MPRSSRLATLLALAAVALASLALTSQAQAASNPAVAAKGSCTEMRGTQLVAVFDVKVRGKHSARVRKGRRNRVRGGRVVGRQPTLFRAGSTRRALRVAFGHRSRRTTWHLGARTATVKRAAKRCAKAKTPAKSTAIPGRPGPPVGPGYCLSAAVTAAWTGTGRTIAATPATLSAAVASAAAGDTVELADGTYANASVTLKKAIRLRAQHPLGAVFVGGPTPRFANDTGLGGHVQTAIEVRASGAMVEGLDLRYYGVGIDLDGVANAVVQGNRVVSAYDAGIQVWDTRAPVIRCNQILDPYLAQDPTASVTSGPSISEAQDDYGVAVYGSLQPRVDHNYFQGVFNQTVSFKEGNRDAYAGYNTFEGSALTALFFGQNLPHNGPYSFTGLPVDEDRGTIVAEYNVFREAYGVRDGAPVVYYLRTPIRIWHVDGTTTVRGNVIEEAQQGVMVECRSGSQAGCNSGTTLLVGNTIGGRVRDLGGAIRQVNTTAGAMLYTGLQAQLALDGNTFSAVAQDVGTYSDGMAGNPNYSFAPSNRALAAPQTVASLRPAAPSTDPDLSYGG